MVVGLRYAARLACVRCSASVRGRVYVILRLVRALWQIELHACLVSGCGRWVLDFV